MPWLHGQRPGAARRATGFPCPRQYMHDDDVLCRVLLWMPPAFLRPLPLPWLYLLPVKKGSHFLCPALLLLRFIPAVYHVTCTWVSKQACMLSNVICRVYIIFSAGDIAH